MNQTTFSLRNRRVLVTGGSGFVGSAVVLALKEHGCEEVVAPSHEAYDLNLETDVQRLFDDVRPEVVIHCAGRVGGVAANLKAPAEFFYDNIRMNVYVVHYAFLAGVQKFVAVIPGCSYPNTPPSFPFKEDEIWEGFPEQSSYAYSLARKMLVVQTSAYAKQYGFAALNLVPSNLYGPRDNFSLESSHVVPALIRRFVDAADEGRPIVDLWGRGGALRDFLYIDDCVRALMMAAQRCTSWEPINIGSGTAHSIRAVAETLASLTGFGGTLAWDESKPEGQSRRAFDLTRQEQLIGFKATTTLEAGLRATIDWYRTNRASSLLRV